jgi:BirA family biotin operon repressor/biotin-[acetyl-CoA-carboxylase] ligase
MKNVDFTINLQEIDSTQILAKQIVRSGRIADLGKTLIISKLQFAGRGQGENRWSSNYGGLYFSYIFDIDEKDLKKTKELSIKFARVIKRILTEYGIECVIKYPNDVYAKINDDYKKISGILIETLPRDNKRYVIVGVGVNFTNKIDEEFKDIAVSVYDITGKRYSKKKFLKKFFDYSYDIIERLRF